MTQRIILSLPWRGNLFPRWAEFLIAIDPLAPFSNTAEWSSLILRTEQANPFQFNPPFSLPPVGTCTVYETRGNLLNSGSPLLNDSDARGLNGLLLSGQVGGDLTGQGLVFGDNHEAAVSTPGGVDMGPIRASVSAPLFPSWTNQAQAGVISRSKSLTLQWSSASGLAFIAGGSVDRVNKASALSDASAGSFTVPAWALGHLPVSRNKLGEMEGMLALGLGPAVQSGLFSALGLDLGANVFRSWAANSIQVTQ